MIVKYFFWQSFEFLFEKNFIVISQQSLV